LTVGEISVFVGATSFFPSATAVTCIFSGVRGRCEREPELLKLGSGFVLYALMDAVVDRYFPVIDVLESQLESIEEHIFDKGTALNQHCAAV